MLTPRGEKDTYTSPVPGTRLCLHLSCLLDPEHHCDHSHSTHEKTEASKANSHRKCRAGLSIHTVHAPASQAEKEESPYRGIPRVQGHSQSLLWAVSSGRHPAGPSQSPCNPHGVEVWPSEVHCHPLLSVLQSSLSSASHCLPNLLWVTRRPGWLPVPAAFPPASHTFPSPRCPQPWARSCPQPP